MGLLVPSRGLRGTLMEAGELASKPEGWLAVQQGRGTHMEKLHHSDNYETVHNGVYCEWTSSDFPSSEVWFRCGQLVRGRTKRHLSTPLPLQILRVGNTWVSKATEAFWFELSEQDNHKNPILNRDATLNVSGQIVKF